MTIQKSDQYALDVKTRRLFGRMQTEIVDLSKAIEATLTAAHTMRTALGAATLTLAEVEYVHVTQAHDKRTSDAILFEAQTRLAEMLDTAKHQVAAVSDVIALQVPKVDALGVQAIRIGNKDVVDNEPTGPLSGKQYVGIDHFAAELGCSVSHVRNLITKGAIPPPDAVSESDVGRPKQLWLRHKAAVTIEELEVKGASACALN